MKKGPPSDLDLMLYADGELEGADLAAVEAWLESTPSARSKLAALGLVSEMVRERALDAASDPGDLTSAIMERIEKAVPLGNPVGVLQTPPVAMGNAVAMGNPVGVPQTPPARRAANDNGRGFFLVAAALVAAAAAVLLWSRTASTPTQGPVAHETAPAPIAPAPRPAPETESEVEHGVEVATVDFGESTGAVLYVPNGSSTDTTTVVWLEDSAGEDE